VCWVLGLQGDVDGALAMAAEAELQLSKRRLNDLLAVVQLSRGHAFLSIGHHAEAYIALSRLFDRNDPSFHEVERFHGIADFAEAALYSGHLDKARSIVADLDHLAGLCPAPLLTMQLRLAHAILAGDDDIRSSHVGSTARGVASTTSMRETARRSCCATETRRGRS
jgi:hypothetical protein